MPPANVSLPAGVYVAGGTSTFDVGQGDAVLFKFTADGTLVRDLTWGNPDSTGRGHSPPLDNLDERRMLGFSSLPR